MSPENENKTTELPSTEVEQENTTPTPGEPASSALQASTTEVRTEQATEPAAAPSPASADARPEAADTASAGAPAPETPSEGEAAESTEAMGELINQYAAQQHATVEGEIVEGRVIATTELGVVVDVGGKTEGLIPQQELLEADVAGLTFTPGQTVEVQLTNEEKEGYLILSFLRARRRRAWENIEKSYRQHVNLTGRVMDRIKGGLVVDVGIRAFLPASHVDLRPTHDLESWKGREISVRVLKMNRKRGNVVVSRRVILEEEQRAKREELMNSLVEGAVLTGKVKNLTEYGVFVDLGGLDGLLHVTDLVWGRITHPSEVVQVGQEIQVKVLKFDKERMRVSLGHKQLQPDPWENVPQQYTIGQRTMGRVVGITDYGAFVEIAPGVEGLVHISEMTWSKRMKHPSKIVHVGDEVEVVILDIKPEQRRISLGLKQTLPDPWLSLAEKYPVGSLVTGKVRNLTDFGAFVEIEEGIDGLIHVSDISWTERVKHPSEVFKKGDTVTAKVLKVDAENRRLSLGVKQVNDIWSDWFAQHKVNDVVRGRVARSTTFGVFVELAPGIEALCHISEIEDRRGKGEKASPQKGGKQTVHLEVGQEYDFKIIKFDPNQHKIGLSYRAAQKQTERKEMEEYRSSKSSPTATLGDLIWSKRESQN
jgi:small subunit ribosomal protein S1